MSVVCRAAFVFLALSCRIIFASAINVPAGDTAALIAAINACNSAGGSHTITLAKSDYTFYDQNNFTYGANALPVIACDITIDGAGSTFSVGDLPPTVGLRFFYVAVKLSLKDLTLSGGRQFGGSGQAAGNGPGRGGAIFNDGQLSLSGVTLAGNTATGDADAGTGAAVDPEARGNGMGGAIFNRGTVSVQNSTFAGNAAVGGNSAGAGGGAYGGAICNVNGEVSLLCVTAAFNTVNAGVGAVANGNAFGGAVYSVGYAVGDGVTAVLYVINTILADTTGGTDLAVDQPSNVAPGAGGGTNAAVSIVVFVGANIVASGGVLSNAIVTAGSTTPLIADPMLNALADNGGPAQTLLPALNSPARNAGAAASVAGLTTDQRAQPRLTNGTLDIGAVETNYALVAYDGDNQTATVGSAYIKYLIVRAEELGSGIVYDQVTVTMTAPATGASGIFSAPATGDTKFGGYYIAPLLDANTLSGPFTVTATAPGFAPAQFTLRNLPGPQQTMVIFAGDNQTQTTGKVLPFQQCVLLRDSFGNGVPNVKVTFEVTSGGGNVTGAFTLSNPQGIGINGTWRVGPLPGDNTLKATAEGLDIPVIFHSTATNLAPVIDSVSYAPPTPQFGDQITFTVAAHDPENATSIISFDYGDGSIELAPFHTYAAPGTYHVIVKVGDGITVVEKTVDLVVGGTLDLNGDGIVSPIDKDTDRDGFPDYIETKLGFNPNSAASTPINNGAGTPLPFQCTLDMTLNRKISGKDSIAVSGTLHLNAGEAINGPPLLLDISGNTQVFILSESGKSKTSNATFTMRVKRKKGALGEQDAPFTAKFKNGIFLANLAANSTPGPTGNPDHAVVTMLFNGRYLRAVVPLNFKSMSNGTIKTLRPK